MPYSPKYSVLFIHIPKNAGKPIERHFEMSTTALLEANFKGRRFLNAAAKWLLNNTMDREFLIKLGGIYDVGYSGMHMTWNELNELNLMPSETGRQVIGLTTVRNPFSRVVSIYKHRRDKSQPISKDTFEHFCLNWIAKPSLKHNVICFQRTQKAFVYNRENRPFTANILRFEKLQEDFSSFCRSHELPTAELPQIGKNSGPDWRELHTPATIDWVQRFYREDFEAFGYPIRWEDNQ